jgi:hypothetical protein
MKTYGEFLIGVYAALFSDIVAWFPEDATEMERHKTRLLSLVKTRGTKYLTIDLVAAGKHLDRCIECGSYIPSGIAGMRPRKGWAIPRLFEGLFRRVFTTRGKLRVNPDLQAYRYLRQLFFTAKKVRMVCDDSATFESVAEFFEIDKAIRPASLPWEADDLLGGPANPSYLSLDSRRTGPTRHDPEYSLPGLGDDRPPALLRADGKFRQLLSERHGLMGTIQRVADLVSCDLGWFDPTMIKPKHGPGAVSDDVGESKYDFPHWPDKLGNLFPAELFAYYNESSVVQDSSDGGPRLSKAEPPSKLIAVPKTQKAPRLIASEPTAHQWIQQGVADSFISAMAKTLLGSCISIRDQEPSRRLALQASSQRHLSTIDLSSASDRVSCWLVERIFRSNLSFLRAFHACRTRWLVNSIDKKLPKFWKLKKFTTMGSALTFPVQSYIYAIVAIGVEVWYSHVGPREGLPGYWSKDYTRIRVSTFRRLVREASKRIRVFGDDIIAPVDSTPLLIEVLTGLGLEVNVHKTFAASFFRESCGIDAYNGVEVTPVYVNGLPNDSEPESLISAIETSNNLFKGGYWRTAAFVETCLPGWVRDGLAVRRVGSGAFGLDSFVGADVSHLKKRWNDQLHHEEARCYVPLARNRKRKIRGSAALLQYFTENPPPDSDWESGVGLRTSLKLKRQGVPVTSFGS